MRHLRFSNLLAGPRLAGFVLGAALALTAGALPADDRNLLGSSSAPPYVFILFDVSGSMNWRPGGDGFAYGMGDDPTSKFYQAKSAMFKVLTDPELSGIDIDWGFATYNQDDLGAYRKHWLYKPRTNPVWFSRLPYPKVGDLKSFGDRCAESRDTGTICDLDANSTLSSCNAGMPPPIDNKPLNINDSENRGEILTYPVMGDAGNVATVEWVRNGSTRFRVDWLLLTSGAIGADTITVRMRVRQYRTNCSTVDYDSGNQNVIFDRAFTQDTAGLPLAGSSDYLMWQIDGQTDIFGNPAGFWDPETQTNPDQIETDDLEATNFCVGWEPNTDAGNDDYGGLLMKYPKFDDPLNRHLTAFDRGDVIPFDWQDQEVWGVGSRDLILKRLAPNYTPCPPDDDTCVAPIPDFRSAPYFQDHPNALTGTSHRLALLPTYAGTPPLMPAGSTPIGASMRDFLNWYDTWKPIASNIDTGDPEFSCRSVNLIVLTDGDETCFGGDTDDEDNRNPCWIADRLHNESERGIKTYVVGYGVPDADANFLRCIAENGGTEDPILPGNEDELVEALTDVIKTIVSETTSFASASPQPLQSNVDDKLFLASFVPVPELDEPAGTRASVWDGHLDAFLRPLPLTAEGLPDESVPCVEGSVEAACHLWDAGEEMLTQSPTLAEIQACTKDNTAPCRLGDQADQRRVYYAKAPLGAARPSVRKLFLPPLAPSDQVDLFAGMGLTGDPQALVKTTETIQFALRQKVATVEIDPGVFETRTYVLGDIFHPAPFFVGSPRRFEYFAADLGGNGEACDFADNDNPGYQCFFRKHEFRRRMLFAASNDGELHAFDAGFFDGTLDEPSFDNGTGRELFSLIPRGVMPTLVEFVRVPGHQWTVDGNVWADDVFIDPVHGGLPTEDDREWRTVAIGGLREGGRSYYALDITQPDEVDVDGLPDDSGSYVPGCTGGPTGAALPPGCGALPFPSLLWEFTDTRDEDLNVNILDPGHDLADTWSAVNTGRVRVCAGSECDPAADPNDLEDRYVAVFGGGLDPLFWDKRYPKAGQVAADPNGNWLYMVDIETGKTIYKRELSGSAASEPSAVDTDRDGYLDTIYVGTTDGFLYKADIRTAAELVDVLLADGTTERRVIDLDWAPFPIFRSVDENDRGRPIFYPPAVIFVGSRGLFAVAFGTGDREDLWADHNQDGAFYVILDEDFTPDSLPVPIEEDELNELPDDEVSGENFLLFPPNNKRPGWFIHLEDEERIITPAFALSGVLVFTSFLPSTFVQGGGAGDELTCAQGGTSRIFVVFTESGNGVISAGGAGERTRFWEVEGFVTEPFTELSVTANPDDEEPEPLPVDLQAILDTLQKIFPADCKFASYTVNLKTQRSDTGVFFIAPIPVCLAEKNWKEF